MDIDNLKNISRASLTPFGMIYGGIMYNGACLYSLYIKSCRRCAIGHSKIKIYLYESHSNNYSKDFGVNF